MSREACGDDGDPPTCWEETAMRQEFDVIRERFAKWLMMFKDDVPSPHLEGAIKVLCESFDACSIWMEGDL